MSGHADTISAESIKRVLRGQWANEEARQKALIAIDALLAENQRLRDALRISYPMTPVDCLLSDLESEGWAGFPPPWFVRRVSEFKDEIAHEALAGDTG